MKRVNVTKTFLPPMEEYEEYLKKIWESGQLTNQGPLVLDLQEKLKKHLGVDGMHFVTNGTIALQVAIESLGIEEGEIITTPFSYVATTSAILWQGCKPVFVDIEPDTFCIDADKIENAITDKTKAILAVHVFGFPCDVEKIQEIAKRHKLKVIFDGAHSFGVKYKNKSLLSYGDISICSFHSTKLFHTIEGGCIIAKNPEISRKVELIKRFGHDLDEHTMLGINAKASEFQAAMGLCNLKYVDKAIGGRKRVTDLYDKLLGSKFKLPVVKKEVERNYAYYPLVVDSEEQLLGIFEDLAKKNIFPRRYFYPSLNTLPYLKDAQSCPVSEDISKRVMCLPLYPDLEEDIVREICGVLLQHE